MQNLQQPEFWRHLQLNNLPGVCRLLECLCSLLERLDVICKLLSAALCRLRCYKLESRILAFTKQNSEGRAVLDGTDCDLQTENSMSASSASGVGRRHHTQVTARGASTVDSTVYFSEVRGDVGLDCIFYGWAS